MRPRCGAQLLEGVDRSLALVLVLAPVRHDGRQRAAAAADLGGDSSGGKLGERPPGCLAHLAIGVLVVLQLLERRRVLRGAERAQRPRSSGAHVGEAAFICGHLCHHGNVGRDGRLAQRRQRIHRVRTRFAARPRRLVVLRQCRDVLEVPCQDLHPQVAQSVDGEVPHAVAGVLPNGLGEGRRVRRRRRATYSAQCPGRLPPHLRRHLRNRGRHILFAEVGVLGVALCVRCRRRRRILLLCSLRDDCRRYRRRLRLCPLLSLPRILRRGHPFPRQKSVELFDILELGVAVEQQGCVVGGGELGGVQLLEVGGEVVDAPRVEKLPNHVRRLDQANSLQVLPHRPVVVLFEVEVVTVAPVHLRDGVSVTALSLDDGDCNAVEVFAEEELELGGGALLAQEHGAPFREQDRHEPVGADEVRDVGDGRGEGEEFIAQVVNLDLRRPRPRSRGGGGAHDKQVPRERDELALLARKGEA
mmetsp:Transcript_5054/g.17542  ORF Transcript_5054/g.17542 Transcript_5054/m.17542 type:complete len:473 (+) Transcript_5054:258-1676(+)